MIIGLGLLLLGVIVLLAALAYAIGDTAFIAERPRSWFVGTPATVTSRVIETSPLLKVLIVGCLTVAGGGFIYVALKAFQQALGKRAD